jgi:hypothetical protein
VKIQTLVGEKIWYEIDDGMRQVDVEK